MKQVSAKHEIHRNIELRRAIASSAFTMIMLMAVVGLFSLFSIWSINRAWTAGTSETAEIQALSRASLDAQVNFKIQVQEWKNILLRGSDPQLLADHLGSFRKNGKATTAKLAEVAGEAERLGFAARAAEARTLRDAHTTLLTRYETTLAGRLAGSDRLDAQAARAIDGSLRGVDRDLENRIGQLAAELAALSEGRRSRLIGRMQERYVALRWFIIGIIALSLAITGYVISGALRATRG